MVRPQVITLPITTTIIIIIIIVFPLILDIHVVMVIQSTILIMMVNGVTKTTTGVVLRNLNKTL